MFFFKKSNPFENINDVMRDTKEMFDAFPVTFGKVKDLEAVGIYWDEVKAQMEKLDRVFKDEEPGLSLLKKESEIKKLNEIKELIKGYKESVGTMKLAVGDKKLALSSVEAVNDFSLKIKAALEKSPVDQEALGRIERYIKRAMPSLNQLEVSPNMAGKKQQLIETFTEMRAIIQSAKTLDIPAVNQPGQPVITKESLIARIESTGSDVNSPTPTKPRSP